MVGGSQRTLLIDMSMRKTYQSTIIPPYPFPLMGLNPRIQTY